jgi:hypothetical protein
MNNKETVIYQGDSKWSRNAYIKFVGDKIVFDCSDGEYGPIEFDIQSFYDAELKHAQDIDNDWDVTLMDGLENEPYVSDDFQIGPDGAYEDVEYSTSIIDEAYKNYTQTKVIKTENGETHISPPGHYNGITQEEFINKCKTDPELFKGWGLKITERELSEEERWRIRFDYYPKDKQFPWDRMALPSHRFLDDFNIPTKLITITYKEQKIESYE